MTFLHYMWPFPSGIQPNAYTHAVRAERLRLNPRCAGIVHEICHFTREGKRSAGFMVSDSEGPSRYERCLGMNPANDQETGGTQRKIHLYLNG
jgi:hypothetical protein